MDNVKKAKLERYLKNAKAFLWGVIPENQKKTYDRLDDRGFKIDDNEYEVRPKGSYDFVTAKLLEKHGIEKILKGLIIPEVTKNVPSDLMNFLRDSWSKGQRPNYVSWKKYKVSEEKSFPFLEINRQFSFVERWGELAGLWFEEIETLIETLTDESVDDFSSAERLYKDYQETGNLVSLEEAVKKLNDAIKKEGAASQKAKERKHEVKEYITDQMILILQGHVEDPSTKPKNLDDVVTLLRSFPPDEQRALVHYIKLIPMLKDE